MKFLGSNIFSAIIGIFTGFFTYRFIEPSQLGIWGVFVIIEVYFSITRLGIINGLGRELPFYMGLDKQEMANSFARTALSYSLWSNLFLLIIIPLTLKFRNIDLSNNFYLFSLIVLIYKLILNSYSSYLSVTFRTNNNFNDLSDLTFLQSLIKILTLIFVFYFGFWGLLLREVLLISTETALLHYKRPIRVGPKFKLNLFRELLKIGFPLYAVSYISGAVDTFPRVFILTYSSAEQLGLFSPIIVVLGLSLIIPNAISSFIYPKMAYAFGVSSDRSEIWSLVKKTAFLSVLVSLPLAILIYFGSDFISILFPKYEKAIDYLKLSSVSVIFSGFKASSISFAVIKSWRIMIIDVFVYFIISISSLFLLKLVISDILLVATFSIAFTNFLMFVITLSLAYRATR